MDLLNWLNANVFSQPFFIIFTKGTNNSDHDCIWCGNLDQIKVAQ